jgi:hypothetical protein
MPAGAIGCQRPIVLALVLAGAAALTYGHLRWNQLTAALLQRLDAAREPLPVARVSPSGFVFADQRHFEDFRDARHTLVRVPNCRRSSPS